MRYFDLVGIARVIKETAEKITIRLDRHQQYEWT